ncbi:MAG: CHAT domain-containing protein [Gemmatimonadaceae bacterium]
MSLSSVLGRAALLLVPLHPQVRTSGDDPRERVAAAHVAVRRDSAAQYAATWRRAMGPDRKGRVAALGVATIMRRTYKYRESDAVFASLIPATDVGVDDITVQSMIGFAQSLLTRWRPAEARSVLDRAAVVAGRLGDTKSQGEALGALAGITARLGSPDSARTLMERAAVLIPPGSALSAQRLCAHGTLLRGSSLHMADSLVSAGIRSARAAGDSMILGRCLLSRGTVLEGQGRIGLADGPIREAARLLLDARDFDGLGATQQWMAYLMVTYSQEFGVGRRWAEQAIGNGERAGNPLVVAWARLNLAQAALRVGDAVSGLRVAREAEGSFQRMRDRAGELAARTIGAEALMLSGRVVEAVQRYAALEPLIVAAGAPNAIPVSKLKRAGGLLELGQIAAAEGQIDSAVAIATARGVRGVIVSSQHYYRGLLELRRGGNERAVAAFQQFKRGVGPNPAHLILDADLRIAEAYARSGRFAEAESVFARGSASLDHMRGSSGDRADVLRLLTGLRYDTDTDLGIATIVSLLAEGQRLGGAFGIAESERARWLWIRRSRRQTMAQRAVAPVPLDERVLDVTDIGRALDRATGVITFVTGRGGEPTTVFAIWSGGARAFRLQPIDSLSRDLARFSTALEGGASSRALARSLGARLLDSALRALPGEVDHLRIVPDGPLHGLPFDALELPDGQRLLERFVVTLAPSARLAVATRQDTRQDRGGRVLAFGDPVFDSRYALPRLPGSAREADAVVRAAGGRGESLLRQHARVAALQPSTWSGVGAIHLATHARVQDWGLLDNAIYLSGQSDDDGRLGADDIVTMSLGVDLVVLSGCRTVGGMVATGEGVQGLVAPVLEAGAQAVAVTQWRIRDHSLIDLMTRFYRGMYEGLTAGDALAAAKRQSLARGESPAVWAAVTLVGDGSVRPLRASAAERPIDAPTSGATFRRRGAP